MSAYDKKPVFLIALALLVACTSCGHDDPDVLSKPTEPDKPAAQIPINISATITRATEEAFESGDRIGLFVVNRNADGSAATLKPLGNHLDNMPYTYTTTWNAEKTVYWKDAQTHADFYMYLSLHADGGKRERHAVRRHCRPEQPGCIQVVRSYRRLHARRRSIGIAGEHRGTSPDESG